MWQELACCASSSSSCNLQRRLHTHGAVSCARMRFSSCDFPPLPSRPTQKLTFLLCLWQWPVPPADHTEGELNGLWLRSAAEQRQRGFNPQRGGQMAAPATAGGPRPSHVHTTCGGDWQSLSRSSAETRVPLLGDTGCFFFAETGRLKSATRPFYFVCGSGRCRQLTTPKGS